MQEKVRQYKEYLKKADAFGHAVGVLNYDFETVMPKGAADHFAKTMGTLSEEMYKMETAPELKALVAELYENRENLDEITRREVEEHREQIARIDCIPMEEYVAYSELQSRWRTTMNPSSPIFRRSWISRGSSRSITRRTRILTTRCSISTKKV